MGEITHIFRALENGDVRASDALLPLVYEELRKLAAVQLAEEKAGQTLQPTALVHEAYLRLMDKGDWKNRGHFFTVAAEATRRILIDQVRRKRAEKRGGAWGRVELNDVSSCEEPNDLLALDEALTRFVAVDPQAAELVKLRYFAGLTMAEAATALAISERTAGRLWAFARAWLRRDLENVE